MGTLLLLRNQTAGRWPLERERKEIHRRAKAEAYDLVLAPFPNVMLLLNVGF